MVELGHQVVWSWPVVAEQFFIGLAAGCFFVAALLHIFAKNKHEDIARLGFYISPIATVIGIIVLDLELGRPERGMNAILNPGTSMISRGSIALMAYLVITIVAAAAWAVPKLPASIRRPLEKLAEAIKRPVELVGLAFSIFIGLYAGLQIGWAVQRQFWFTPFLPWLYFVSAVSMSFAFIGLIALVRGKQWLSSFVPNMAEYVIYLIIAQALIIAAHFATSEGAGTEIRVILSSALYTPGLLLGIFVAGIIGPGILSYYALRAGTIRRSSALVLLALLVIGGFAIRAVFLFAGQII